MTFNWLIDWLFVNAPDQLYMSIDTWIYKAHNYIIGLSIVKFPSGTCHRSASIATLFDMACPPQADMQWYPDFKNVKPCHTLLDWQNG